MNVKFLLDENMPFALTEFFKKKGYEAKHLKKIEKGGIKNGEVYKVAEEHDAWIVTRDSDFKNYRKFSEYNIRGIILFTVNDTRTPNILKLMNRFLEMYSEKLSSKNLITIEDEEVKIYTSE
jgi:predicted nuclease of predicted toxin-antitoxin system